MTPEFTPGPRTALVTGGAKRIGAALGRALCADGWHVAIHCNRSRADADALAAELGRAHVVVGDLADPDVPRRLIEDADAPERPLGLLVNNASLFDADVTGDFTAGAWDMHMAVNARAPALLTQAFAAALAGRNGLVVNMLDVKLFALNPDFFSYTVSKYALLGLTEIQARALAPSIRVNGIAPAVTMVSGPQSRENFEKAHTYNPLRRGVDVDDLVRALRYLVASPTVTGQVLTVDAGQRLMGMPRDVAYMVAP